MIKTIKIGDKQYDMKSSAYTMFAYKNENSGRDLLSDINSISREYTGLSNLSEEEQQSAMMETIQPLIEKTLRLAYIMIKEQNKDFMCFDDFLREQDGILENQDWIMEVLELGMSPFRRGIFSTQNK